MNDRKSLIALCLLVPAPSLGVLMSMMIPATRGTAFGQGIYIFAKIWLLVLPLIWTRWIDKKPFQFSALQQKGSMVVGLISGLVIAAAILAAWYLFGQDWINPGDLREKVAANGIGTPLRYLLLVTYLTLVNSLLEEFVWRWFVYRKFEALVGGRWAVFLAALCFTLHHVLALKAQMSWIATILGSLGVCTGGLIWSWLYHRYRSIWPGYLSHLIADAAIFLIGWQLIFG